MSVNTAPAPTSPNVHTQQKPLRFVMTGLDSNIPQFAREAAHEKHASRQFERGSIWKNVAESAWHTLTREYQLVRDTQEARQAIIENNNLRHHHGESDQKWREDTLRRYTSDFGEHLIHQDAGETFHKLEGMEAADPETPAGRVRGDILGLVREFAKGNIIDASSLHVRLEETVAEWRKEGVAQEYIGEGRIWASNMVSMAEQVKAALDARQGLTNLQKDAELDQILAGAEVIVGEAKVGSRVEIDATVSERLAEKMKKKKWVSEKHIDRAAKVLTDERVVAGMMSVGIAVAQKGGSFLMATALPGAGAGIVAAWRERRARKGERALQGRRADAGQENAPANEAQEEMSAVQYEARPAGDLLDEIGALYDKNGDLTLRDRGDLEKAMRILADVNARVDLDCEGKRLINFADISANEMEGRRFDIEMARAKLETDLEKLYTNSVSTTMLGIAPGETFEQALKGQKDAQLGLLRGEIKKKDILFNKIVLRQSFRKFRVAMAMSLIGGGILQSVAASGASQVVAGAAQKAYGFARDFFAHGGLFGAIFGGNKEAPAMDLLSNDTPLEPEIHGGAPPMPEEIGVPQMPDEVSGGAPAMPGEVNGQAPPMPEDIKGQAPQMPSQVNGGGHDGSAPSVPSEVKGGAPQMPEEVKGSAPPMPEEVKGNAPPMPEEIHGYRAGETLILSDTAKVNLPEGFTADHNGNNLVITTPDGETFTAALNKDGTLTDATMDELRQNGLQVIPQEATIEGEPKITHEKVDAREFVERHKSEMTKTEIVGYFGNEPDVYDKNELRLDNHMKSDGDIVISIDRMTAEGSYNESDSVDPHKAARAGKIKVFLSAASGSQSYSYEFPIGENDKLVIDKDHPARALFNEDGEFIGGRQRVALVGGIAPNGAVEITPLATVVGQDANSFTDTVITPTYETAHVYTIIPFAEEAVGASTNFNGVNAAQYGTFEPGHNDLPPISFPVYTRRTFGAGQPASAQPKPQPAFAGAGIGARGGAPTTPPPPSPPPPPSSGGPAASDQDGQSKPNQAPSYSPQVEELLRQMNGESGRAQDIPAGLGLDATGLDRRAVQFIQAMTYAAEMQVRANGIGPGDETVSLWRRRSVLPLMKAQAQRGIAGIAGLPPELQPVFRRAFEAILRAS